MSNCPTTLQPASAKKFDEVGHLDMSNFVARGTGRASVGQGIQPTQEQPKNNPIITQEEPYIYAPEGRLKNEN